MGVCGGLGRGATREEYEVFGQYDPEQLENAYGSWEAAVQATGYEVGR